MMKKHININQHMKAFAHFMQPMTAKTHHFKTFKLSQQHKGVKK